MRAGARRSPASRCNQSVKFTDLLGLARDLGADCLATGHYVRRVAGPNGAELHRAADPARDQSYFLFATTREQLDFLRFPLGDLPKPAVREIARELGLIVADKPDSQDICFVPDGDYARVVEEGAARGGAAGRDRRPRRAGARRAIAASSISPSASAAGSRSAARPSRSTSSARARERAGSWSGRSARSPSARAARRDQLARRGPARRADRQGPLAGAARAGRVSTASAVHFAAPEYGVAPGQAAVLYDGERVLGGGWIEETVAAELEPA